MSVKIIDCLSENKKHRVNFLFTKEDQCNLRPKNK